MPPYKNKKNDLHFFKNMFIIVLSPWWWRNQINAHIDEKVLHFGMISRMNRDCELVLLRLQATLSLWTCARCITRALWCATRCPCWVTAFSGTCLPRAKENAGWDRSDTTMPVWDRDAKKKKSMWTPWNDLHSSSPYWGGFSGIPVFAKASHTLFNTILPCKVM